jgi:hypothetical protein
MSLSLIEEAPNREQSVSRSHVRGRYLRAAFSALSGAHARSIAERAPTHQSQYRQE